MNEVKIPVEAHKERTLLNPINSYKLLRARRDAIRHRGISHLRSRNRNLRRVQAGYERPAYGSKHHRNKIGKIAVFRFGLHMVPMNLSALCSCFASKYYCTSFGVRVLKPEILMLTSRRPFKANAQLNGTVFLNQSSSLMGKDGTCPVSRPIWTEPVGPQSRPTCEV